MTHGLSKTKTMRGDRSGLSAVEFALLLPFFALTAAGVLTLAHLVHRAAAQSYLAFSAARRAAATGSAGSAAGWVRREYADFSMSGTPRVTASFSPGIPGMASVTIQDRLTAVEPGPDGRRLDRIRSGAVVSLSAAGAASFTGGDNDF